VKNSITSIECFIVTIPRDTPYLGPLMNGEKVNSKGYIVRQGNRTIYPTSDRSVVIRITTNNGLIGWGETYGICTPEAVCSIIGDLLSPVIIGRDPFEVSVIWEDLYDQMRVRGFTGGFYLDALAAIDIALWDVCGKITSQPVYNLLGGKRRSKIPAYISGLPQKTLAERCEFAQNWQAKGFQGFKFAAVVSDEDIIKEMRALREALGPSADIMIDMHWKYMSADAVSLINAMQHYNLYFAEAPVATEDVNGLVEVAQKAQVAIAAGEEWRTVYEASRRIEKRACSVVQPEMGHTGITQFMRIANLAGLNHCRIIPHASIGIGIFQAASLQAAATIQNLPYHEYQHSVFDNNRKYIETTMSCEAGHYSVPSVPGIGAEPNNLFWEVAKPFNN